MKERKGTEHQLCYGWKEQYLPLSVETWIVKVIVALPEGNFLFYAESIHVLTSIRMQGGRFELTFNEFPL